MVGFGIKSLQILVTQTLKRASTRCLKRHVQYNELWVPIIYAWPYIPHYAWSDLKHKFKWVSATWSELCIDNKNSSRQHLQALENKYNYETLRFTPACLQLSISPTPVVLLTSFPRHQGRSELVCKWILITAFDYRALVMPVTSFRQMHRPCFGCFCVPNPLSPENERRMTAFWPGMRQNKSKSLQALIRAICVRLRLRHSGRSLGKLGTGNAWKMRM